MDPLLSNLGGDVTTESGFDALTNIQRRKGTEGQCDCLELEEDHVGLLWCGY